MENTLRQVIDDVQNDDISNGEYPGHVHYDGWGSSYRKEKFNILKKEFIDKGINEFQWDKKNYKLEFTPSNNIVNMGGTPDSIKVSLIN